jgi:thiol-disulfide isomerase/thioredoxin
MAYTDIKKNMPKVSEAFTEPKLKICLYKAEWCGHCRELLKAGTFNSAYESIKDKPEYKDVVFVTYDFDENKALAEKYNINSFPSIIAVDKDGNLLNNFEGNRNSKDDLIKFVDQNLKS